MQCLYCGKKLSLLRKLADRHFCSDEHREAHRRLQDELALTRLGNSRASRPGPAPAAPKGGHGGAAGIPPFAPLQPQAAVWSDCRRVVPIPLQSAVFVCDHFLPESGLRIGARGLPAPDAAFWQPPVEPRTQPANLSLIPPPLVLPEGPEPGDAVCAPTDEPAAPIQPLISLEAAACEPEPRFPVAPQPLHRRKLVVIVPESRLRPLAGRPALASGVDPGDRLRPAPLAVFPPGEPFATMAAPCATHFPASAFWIDPPDWITPHDLDDLPVDEEAAGWEQPPLAGACSLPAALAAACGPGISAGASPFWLDQAAGAGPAVPFRRVMAGTGRLPRPGLAPAGCGKPVAPGPHGASQPVSWLASEPSRPSPPGLLFAPQARKAAWPSICGRMEAAVQPVSREARPLPLPLAPLPGPADDPVRPVLARRLVAGGLRAAERMMQVEVTAVALPPRQYGAAGAAPVWSFGGNPPALRCELLPPEPAHPAASLPEEVADRDLEALRLAVADPPPLEEPEQSSVPDGFAAEPAPPAVAEPAAIALPAVEESSRVTEPDAEAESEPVPAFARRLPMMPVRPVDSFRAPAVTPSAGVSARWDSLAEARPALPALLLHLDHADGSGPRRQPGKRPAKPAKPRRLGRPGRFWGQAPSDLKWIAVALPLLLVVVVYSFHSKAPKNTAGDTTVTPAAAAVSDNRQAAQRWMEANAIQRFIMRRAGIRLFDDFRNGLSAWQGAEGWAKSWRYGDATFIQPGDLALLSNSLGLRDYTLTFLGQIDRRSLNWVFRARDLGNYYAMRIVITRGGPLPEAVLIRSIVVGGKERELKTLPIPFPVQADTLYHVRMEIRGQDYTTYIQNQVVDHFSDARLASGGIGFYSPRGDRALLRWVEVSHQYDYLGRLCALLSPYGVQALPAD